MKFLSAVQSFAGSRAKALAEEMLTCCSQWDRRLAEISDVSNQCPGAMAYGTIVGRLCAGLEPPDAWRQMEALTPLFDWRYGVSAIREGLDIIGWSVARDAVTGIETLTLEDIHSVWVLGLLSIAASRDVARRVAFGGHSREYARKRWSSYLVSLHGAAHQALTQRHLAARAVLWQSPATARTHRGRLWLNGLAMAQHHHPDPEQAHRTDTLQWITRVLCHASRQDMPPDTVSWLTEAQIEPTAHVTAISGFAQTAMDSAQSSEETGGRAEFLDDPLEILNIGNLTESCLRMAANTEDVATAKLLGWAINPTVRIMVVRDNEQRITSRRTIGLRLGTNPGVLTGPTYPPDDFAAHKKLESFLDAFLLETGLARVHSGEVSAPLCRNYDLDWQRDPLEVS